MTRKLKDGGTAHEFTDDDRSRGGHARAEKLRANKEEKRQLALERAGEFVDAALNRLEASLDSHDQRVALQAARDVLDRVLGKATFFATPDEQPLPMKIDMSVLSDEELAELKRILLKAKP
jgi:hypothetical protein